LETEHDFPIIVRKKEGNFSDYFIRKHGKTSMLISD